MRKPNFVIVIYFTFGIFLFGCIDGNIKIAEIGTYPQPLIESLPLKIGIYYKEEFQKFETTQGDPWFGPINIQLGKANTVLFNYILPHVFKEVTPIHHIPEDISKIENIDAIIEPSIDSYQYDFSTHGLALECYVEITYGVTFHSPYSPPIGPWLITGHGFSSGATKWVGTEIKEATKTAMRDVAAQFMAGFCFQTEIKKLLYKQCNQ